MLTKNCAFCKKKFSYKDSMHVRRGKFCSLECYGKSKRGKPSHPWTVLDRERQSLEMRRRYASIPKTLTCVACGKVFPYKESGHQKYCSHACYVTLGDREQHPFLRGKHTRAQDGVAIPYASSYEKRLMELLDFVSVPWVRPNWGFPWQNSDGTMHNYYPDFYLPEEHVYLETKGYVTDKDRMKWEQFPEPLVVIQNDDLCVLERGKV